MSFIRIAVMLLTHSNGLQASGDCWAPLVRPGQRAEQVSTQELTILSHKPASTLRATSLAFERDANAQGGCRPAGAISCNGHPVFDLSSPHAWATLAHPARRPFQALQQDASVVLAHALPAAPSGLCPSQRPLDPCQALLYSPYSFAHKTGPSLPK